MLLAGGSHEYETNTHSALLGKSSFISEATWAARVLFLLGSIISVGAVELLDSLSHRESCPSLTPKSVDTKPSIRRQNFLLLQCDQKEIHLKLLFSCFTTKSAQFSTYNMLFALRCVHEFSFSCECSMAYFPKLKHVTHTIYEYEV